MDICQLTFRAGVLLPIFGCHLQPYGVRSAASGSPTLALRPSQLIDDRGTDQPPLIDGMEEPDTDGTRPPTRC